MTQKTELRRQWLQIRKSIPSERREKAPRDLLATLGHEFKGSVLSFASFGSEIDTTPLNHSLASQGLLFLPRVAETGLTIHLVKDLAADLIQSNWGMMEPDPKRCPSVDPRSLETILVPGISFDSTQNRLGYGQGHYDRLLSQLSCQTIGIAFHEQKADRLTPDPWDIPVQKVLFF